MNRSFQYILVLFSLIFESLICQCEEEFTYNNTLPNNINILLGDSCFYNEDLEGLADLISINNLEYDNAFGIGTQSWFNGRLKILVAGNYGNSSGVNDTIFSLPESIGNWTGLSGLYLEWNRISSLPSSFENLKELRSLYISNNILEGVIENLDSLSNLKYLDLGYNKINQLPISICSLTELQYLWLFNNNLSSLPECMCDMNIDWSSDDSAWFPFFAIGGNSLCENIPECISNSQNFNISLDQFYYSFQIDSPQECDFASINDLGNIPYEIKIENPYPNPFNPKTSIRIDLKKSGMVEILIYDLKGSLIQILNDQKLDAGEHTFNWDAGNYSNGVYLMKINTTKKTFVKKVILMK